MSSTMVDRWQKSRHNEQARRLTLTMANNLRRSAGEALEAFPMRRSYLPHFIPSKMTKLREGVGGLGDVALLLWLAPDKSVEDAVMGFLEGVLAAKHAEHAPYAPEELVADLVAEQVDDSYEDMEQARLIANPRCPVAQQQYVAKAEPAARHALRIVGRIKQQGVRA